MGVATPEIPYSISPSKGHHNYINKNLLNSMSQDYHQGFFSFSNGFERSQQEDNQHRHHQIPRDHKRFDPPPLVNMVEEDSGSLPVYETTGMLSEMFTYSSTTAPEFLDNQISQSYRNPRPGPAADWILNKSHNSIGNADSAAAMQLFLMNPQHQRSPSPSPPTSSTLHMMLPNNQASFGQLITCQTNPSGVMEGQGLSLSLSSSLGHLEGAKGEELRMEDSGMMFFGSNSGQYHFKNFGANQLHVGLGSHLGAVNILRSSKYVKAAQELLEEFCSVGRGQFKKNKFSWQNNSNSSNNNNNKVNPNSNTSGGGGNSSSSTKDPPPLSAADRVEYQRRKVKLLSMLDEVDKRYNHYCEQMQMVVNSFDIIMGYGAAVPYTCLAQKAMSRHFRCLKDAISAQLKQTYETLGEKDAGTSGITKGETPRLRILEQSLRQQRAFHQMGMMEQEAWRPQRGLPERSVNILRAWLFEHFLHPYPSDPDKHLLARQTGLSRNQVSNWFINARVRLWKPMVEEMYQQEAKDETEEGDQSSSSSIAGTHTINHAQTPTTTSTTTAEAAAINRSEINAADKNPSFIAFNRHGFSENQAKFNNTNNNVPAMFGTSTGDVSLTLGLRHAGNLTEKSPFFS